MSKEMRKHIDSFKYFLLKENKESNDIIDYYNSKNIILVGMETNLLPDMKRRYDFEVNGDEIYFFDKGFHFGTLFKEGRFYELRHDGTLDEYGWRKTDDDDTIEGNIEYNNFMFNFMSRGEIRKKAEELLGQLSAAYLGNIAWDNREEIQKRLDDINNSGIDWDKDVVKSVRDNYRQLTSSEVINSHMNRSGDGFSK